MYHEARAKHLDAFPAVRSRNAEEVEAGIIQTYGARRFSLSHRNTALNVHANHWESRNIALSFCSYGADVQVDFPGAGFFRQQICLEGGADNRVGGTERDLTLKKTYVVPPETPLRTHFSPNFEQIGRAHV